MNGCNSKAAARHEPSGSMAAVGRPPPFTTPPLLKECRILTADHDIKVIGLFYPCRLRVTQSADVAFKRVAHQDRHRIARVVRLARDIHLGDQPRCPAADRHMDMFGPPASDIWPRQIDTRADRKIKASGRRVCRVPGQHLSTQRSLTKGRILPKLQCATRKPRVLQYS